MNASDVMVKGVVSVSPGLLVAEFEAFLSSEEISGAPVVDETGTLLGVVSQTDVIRVLGEESSDTLHELLAPDLTVEQIMTRSVVTVSEDQDLKSVARKMVDGHLHRAIVTNGDGLSGIITSFDLLRLLL